MAGVAVVAGVIAEVARSVVVGLLICLLVLLWFIWLV